MEEDREYRDSIERLAVLQQTAQTALGEARQQMKAAKARREEQRKSATLTPEEEGVLIRESQFQKAEYKRQERSWKEKIAPLQKEITTRETRIQELKTECKTRSAALQQQLFEQFRMLNYRGEVRTLCDIFEQTVHKTPPAGTGGCAAPKLLQYAYLNGLRPIAMAEF